MEETYFENFRNVSTTQFDVSTHDSFMGNIPAYRVQNADNNANEVTNQCLSNSVVLRTRFENFTNFELLELSTVNKTWNFEARTVMRKRGDLFAHLKHNCIVQHADLTDFAENLRRCNVLPFSGISIDLLCCCRHSYKHAVLPTPALLSVLDSMTIKQISIKVSHELLNADYCAGLMQIKTILRHYSDILEVLTFFGNSALICVQQFCNFPRLKILKLFRQNFYTETIGNRVKLMISGAPHLQELHSGRDMVQWGKLLKGSSAVLVYTAFVEWPQLEKIVDMMGALRLQVIKLCYTGPGFNFDKFNTYAPLLLHASTRTLLHLQIDAVLAVSLMCYGVCLQNVKLVDFFIDYNLLELIQPRLLKVVKEFDFYKIFPSLDQVKVYSWIASDDLSSNHMNQIVKLASAVLKTPELHRALNVKKLSIRSPSPGSVQFYAEMFPNINELGVDCFSKQIPIQSIWKYWMCLEQLKVYGMINKNLDSVFCGIFPEEVAELILKDEEYLKRVNIVPVMPAITCLRNLKTFTLIFLSHQDLSLLFSKVAGITAFARCPQLSINLVADTKLVFKALRCMKPYASVFYKP